MAAVCHSTPNFTGSSSYIGNARSSSSIPLSKRRKVLFLYHSLYVSGPAFQWACENLLRPGYDHVTLLNAFTDEAYQICDTKKLWKVATDEITVEVEYKKKLDRLEQELEILRLSLSEMDIISRKVILPDGDSKANIVNMAHSLNAELIIMSSNPVNGLQRAIYGSLEDYLLRNGPCSVVVAKPRARSAQSPPLRGRNKISSGSQFSSPSSVGNSTAVSSPAVKPASTFQASTTQINSTQPSPAPLPQVYSETSSIPDTNSTIENSPNLEASDSNTFGLANENINYTLNSSENSDSEEANALSTFQEQLNQYQTRAESSFDISDNEWGLGQSFSVSSDKPEKSESKADPVIPIAQDDIPDWSVSDKQLDDFGTPPTSPHKNISNSNLSSPLGRKPSVLFKPPPPQPRVKHIIDNLPQP